MGTEGFQDRYINPYTDFGFKLLFGTDMNKELLVSFLNALLFGKEVIKNVTYLNTEHLGTQEYDRRAVFDVYCENEQGEKILVEMQRGEQQFFKDRSLYYATFPIREQAPRGEWDYELKGVYVIGILNFVFHESPSQVSAGEKSRLLSESASDCFHHQVQLVDLKTKEVFYDKLTFIYLEMPSQVSAGEKSRLLSESASDCFHHQVQLVDLKTKEVFYDKLTFIYLEMPKFNKTEAELETMFDKWMFVLRNLSGLLERPSALQERVFNRLFKAAEIAAFSPQRRSEYWESLKNYRDWKNVLDTNMKKRFKAAEIAAFSPQRRSEYWESLKNYRDWKNVLDTNMKKSYVKGREEGLAEGIEKRRAT